MPEVAHSIDIDAPAEAVFDFLDDFANDTRWRSNVVEMVALGDADDPHGTWSRQVERRKVPGRIIETEAIIIDRMRPTRLAVQRATGPVRPIACYEIASRGGRSHLDFKVVVPLEGSTRLLAPIVVLLLAVIVRPTLPGDFARLKTLVERTVRP